jgi:hypothetical protein
VVVKRVSRYGPIVRHLARAADADVDDLFGAAEETDLDSMTDLGIPDSVLDFYREHAPIETIELGEVHLWAVPQLLEENHTYPPGAEVHEFGYVVIAGKRNGDVYCLDLGEWRNEDPPRVVLLPHRVEIKSRDRAEVDRQAVPITESFEDFLLLLAREDLPG